jgi:hypothetical protein
MPVTFDKLLGKVLLHNHKSADITDLSTSFLSISSILVDTKVNILSTIPSTKTLAFASDTGYFYFWNGSNWKESATKFSTRTSQDMGLEVDSSLQGYGDDYITDKTLYNMALGGHPATPSNGSLRVNTSEDPDTLEIYLRSQWNTIIYDLTTSQGDFRHAPVSESIQVWSGNSVSVGLNGLPIVQEYQVSMGAYPYSIQISGGSF